MFKETQKNLPVDVAIFSAAVADFKVTKKNETKVHINSLQKIKKIFMKKYPKLTIELKIISLNSKVETFK